jgi:hypothetical protein
MTARADLVVDSTHLSPEEVADRVWVHVAERWASAAGG